MAQIITFLGKGGTGRTTIAIATARKLANLGSRVLLVGQDPLPTFNLLLNAVVGTDPTDISDNFQAVSVQSTLLLEKAWDEVKQLEAQYLRSPTLKNVFGQELSVLPGMDSALALNALREYNESGKYDVIIYDGAGDLTTLKMLGIPETLSWYIRRFRQLFVDSDLGKAISPFIQPVTSAILNPNAGWVGDNFGQQPTNQAQNMLEQGKQVLADPQKFVGYLVTDETESAIATAQYFWGSAQQIGLTVGGVLLNQGETNALTTEFDPLTVHPLPTVTQEDWQPLIDALPDLRAVPPVPKPVEVDVSARQIKVFLPSFDKKQVKLTQYGPEVTIEAGDQRRNLDLPPQLRGRSVTGAKFQEGYLIISL
jgi:anion-transporting  ArsA/GET3 family ATPase